MRLLPITLALALSASGAHAQVTTCGEEIGKWVCRSRPAVQYPDFFANNQAAFDQALRSAQLGQQQRDARAAADRQTAQIASEEGRRLNAQHVRQMVGDQIAQGHCAYAKTLALQAGDLDLAEQAQRLCKQ
jgi:hypothetical protein